MSAELLFLISSFALGICCIWMLWFFFRTPPKKTEGLGEKTANMDIRSVDEAPMKTGYAQSFPELDSILPGDITSAQDFSAPSRFHAGEHVEKPSLSGKPFDVDIFAARDEYDAQLAMAETYIELGSNDQAALLLNDVLSFGDVLQQSAARELLKALE